MHCIWKDIIELQEINKRYIFDLLFLHTMPGYCYLTPGWNILRQCYPTLPNYFLRQQQQQKFSSMNYPKQRLYLG